MTTMRQAAVAANKEANPRGSKAHQFTPREAAYAITIEWIRAAYIGRTSDVANMSYNEPNAARYKREIEKQLAKLHDRLLAQSGMDGVNLFDAVWHGRRDEEDGAG